MNYKRILNFTLFISLLVFISCSLNKKDKKILLNSNRIVKKYIVKSFIRGKVTKIQRVNLDNFAGEEIAVIGQTDIWFLSSNDYSLLKKSSYKTTPLGISPQLVDINRDGIYEIMRGGRGYGKTDLIDNKGHCIWRFKTRSNINPIKMIAGDLDNDKNPEFYVADYGGIYALDVNGKILWKTKKQIYDDINIIDNPQLKEKCIIGLSSPKDVGEFYIYNKKGTLVKKINPHINIYGFDIIDWPENQNILIKDGKKRKIVVLNTNGDIIFDYGITKAFPLYHSPKGLSVRFKKKENPFLVVLLNSSYSKGLTLLSIFSFSGDIIYQEIIGVTRDLYAHTLENGDEVLLVGDGSMGVLEYSYK